MDEDKVKFYETFTGTITLREPLVNNLHFYGGSPNKEWLTITVDGRMIIGEGLSTEEATQHVAEMLVEQYAMALDKALVSMRDRALRAEADLAKLKGQVDGSG